jgi:hypothetical protein
VLRPILDDLAASFADLITPAFQDNIYLVGTPDRLIAPVGIENT